MSSPNRMTTDEWISLQQACLDAICDVSDRIQFDCKVDETGRSAYMLYLEEESAKVTFDPEIPIPNECIEATTQMAGPEELKKMQEVFRTGAVDFFHFSQNPEDMHMHGRKSIFQLLPGQCSVLEIFQQTWYQWYGNTHGSPPPPIPLINFRAVQPGQVVHVEASDFLCYKRGFAEQDRQLLSRWYETVLDNRWHLAFACMLVANFVFESLATFSIMIELVPFTLCLVAISSDDDEGGNRIRTVLRQFWRIWKVLVGLCIVNMTVGETDQVYLICGLAAASMLFYNNSKAAMEWGFLHILAYVPHWESEAMVMTFLQVDDAIDMIFPVPMPGSKYHQIFAIGFLSLAKCMLASVSLTILKSKHENGGVSCAECNGAVPTTTAVNPSSG
eukprot:scaffold8747_cov96-Cylindrotheca_fusiformis.AAC.8